MIIFHDIQQRSEEWYNLRKGRFTASSIKNLFAKESTQSFRDELFRVQFEKETGQIPEDEKYNNQWMQRGIELESKAREYFENKYFCKVKNGGFFEYNDWFGCSPDGIVTSEALLEIKCPKYTTLMQYHEDNCLPGEYKYQIHSQMLASGYNKVIFLAWHPQYKPFEIEVKRDESICNDILEKIEYAKKIILKKITIL